MRQVEIKHLKEQDVNANVMAPAKFERLVENIRERGALESAPYCIQPGNRGSIEIVSGHHRVRAARAAGFETIAVLVDTSDMSRSQITAKQLAHNALNGADDPDILKQLAEMLETPDDRLRSGLDDEIFGDREKIDAMKLFVPRIDFDYRSVSFTFLPHQQQELERLVALTDGRQDLVMVCPSEQFEEILLAASKYARFKKVLAGATAVSLMTRAALAEIEAAEEDEPAAAEG